jgi:hypothetical protein
MSAATVKTASAKTTTFLLLPAYISKNILHKCQRGVSEEMSGKVL